MRASLPIDAVLPALVASLQRVPVAIVQAPTGSGKTTRVPPALLDAGLAGQGKLILLQPRQVAARLAARRIASERGCAVGEEVGFQVRFERRASARTRIEVWTEGLLTRRLQADPFLEGIGLVILDEVHERSVHTDLALALLREVQAEARPDLRLVLMSATLDPAPYQAFFGGPAAAPLVEAEGRSWPVEISHVARTDERPLPDRAAEAVQQAVAGDPQGHILVFLPGVGEIEATADRLGGLSCPVLPLHGRLRPEVQEAALAPSERPKVVLSTNLAESSVTLPGVCMVIDSGEERQPVHDPAAGISRLERVPIAQDSADQRAGRAGRTGPGRCYRLWTALDHQRRAQQRVPEIQRIDLCRLVLEIRGWGADSATFGWFEAPPSAALAAAESTLRAIGALDDAGLTARGRSLLALPLEPRLGAVVLAGQAEGCLWAAAGAAALCSEPDPWEGDPAMGGDLLLRVEALDGRGRGARQGALARVRAARDQLVRAMEGGSGSRGRVNEPALIRALIAGFPERIGQRREPGSPRFLLAGGAGATLGPGCRVDGADLIVAAVLDGGRKGPRAERIVRVAAPFQAEWCPPEERVALTFDTARGAVLHERQRGWGAVVLDRLPAIEAADPMAVSALLLEAARARPEQALRPTAEDEQLLARVQRVARALPEEGWFTVDSFADLLAELCVGRRSLADLQGLDLSAELRARLGWARSSELEILAPTRVPLPRGATARIHYPSDPAQLPILSARIQQLFGLREAPRIVRGRVGVMVHLLAPNMRPAQVTTDLAGFWSHTYAEVRRELRGRYPRHDWPEDPFA